MHRLVIGLTSLLALAGVGVIAVSVFLGGATTDRAATLAPADSVAYVSVYLQPSTGQQAQLASVLSRLPGFEDRAALDSKIDELAQRFLGQAGIDYRADVKPWLGNQVAVAASGMDDAGQPTGLVVLADIKDEAAALARIGGLPGASGTTETTYQGVSVRTGTDTTYAIVSGMMVLSQDAAAVHHVIDTAQGRGQALAGVTAFSDAMRALPADRLATAWYDLRPTIAQATSSATPDTAGFSTLALALRAEEAGFRLTAQLPVDAGSAGAAVRDALAAGAQVAQLANAMPADTEVAAMLFNLRATLQRAESEVKARDENVGATIDQLRALAAFGLGINIDNDLLPLLDGEVGVCRERGRRPAARRAPPSPNRRGRGQSGPRPRRSGPRVAGGRDRPHRGGRHDRHQRQHPADRGGELGRRRRAGGAWADRRRREGRTRGTRGLADARQRGALPRRVRRRRAGRRRGLHRPQIAHADAPRRGGR